MSSFHPAVVLDSLTYAWPDGTTVLDGVSGTFGRGRTGLVGANGVGKSTLLRLVLGHLTPTAGSVTVDGAVAHLDQFVHRLPGATVADLLGVRAVVDALAAIESGSTDQAAFDPALHDTVGDAWDVHERGAADLAVVGLGGITLDRPLDTLSGGEIMLAALTGLRREPADVTMLDEPTNNLDRTTRARVHEVVATWPGTLVVVSHDVALLDRMDATAELHSGALATFGGGFSAWREHLESEQAAAEQTLRTAEQKLRAEKRQRQDVETRLAHRSKQGAKASREKRVPKILANTRKFQSENSMAKVRGTQEDRIDEATEAIDSAAGAIREDRTIRIELPDPGLSPRRRLVELTSDETTFELRGSEHVALIGRNGIGKTRLLRQLVDRSAPIGQVPAVAFTARIGHLDQRLDDFDDDLSVLDTVRTACPSAPPGRVRGQLARFLLRDAEVTRPVGSLSGGERFRVALARLLLAEPAHELLVLDEPTNNLDLDSVDALVSALSSSRSGLIVVSHDDAFLERLGIDRWLELSEDGLTEVPGPEGAGISPTDEQVV